MRLSNRDTDVKKPPAPIQGRAANHPMGWPSLLFYIFSIDTQLVQFIYNNGGFMGTSTHLRFILKVQSACP